MLERLLLSWLARGRGEHSAFAPSASAMWMGCSGSLIPNLLMPDEGSREAAEGTVAHKVAEQWLTTGRKPRALVGTSEWVEAGDWGYLVEIDEAMLDYVQQYVDWCWSLSGDHFIEQWVDFSAITPIPNQGGTADHLACEFGRLTITDLKYGKGVQVFAKGNTQAQLYALGAFYEWDWLYDFQEIVIRIAQPRLDHFDEWVISREELLAFADYARERAHAAWRLNAPRRPSLEACQWCKVRASCTALAKLSADLTAAAFEVVDEEVTAEQMQAFKEGGEDAFELADLGALTLAEMASLYRYREMVEGWWKALGEELHRQAVAGEEVPGYKLVEGRSHRLFRSAEAAERRLKELGVPEDAIWKRTLATPAQAEKELRKVGYSRKEIPDLLADLVFKPVGKPTLVPASDKRPALVDVSAAAFADLTEKRDDESEEL